MPDADIIGLASYFTAETRWALENTGLRHIVEALDATDGAVRSVVDAAISSLTKTSWVGELGARWVSHCARGEHAIPIFAGGLADGGADVVKTGLVFRNAKVAVALQAFDSLMLHAVKVSLDDAGMDILLGRSSVIKVVNGGSLTCHINEYQPITSDYDFDLSLKLLSSREIYLDSKSEPFVIDGRRHGIRFIGSKCDPLLINVTDIGNSLPFRVNVSRLDGRILAINANNDADNIVRTMMTVLRQLGANERRPILERYLGHPTHFVRWHALRELALLDPLKAVGYIARSASEERGEYMRRNVENLGHHLESVGEG